MGLLAYLQPTPPPGMEASYCQMHLFAILISLFLLYQVSIMGRPVAHPHRKLGSTHKAAEAERVEILERLHNGPKAGDAHLIGQLSDPLRSPLLADCKEEATGATITLSCGTQFFPRVFGLMMGVSEAAACGELVDESIVYNPERTMLQTEVKLDEGIFERLKELVRPRGMAVPSFLSKESTPILQVDNWAILTRYGEDFDLLRLPVDKVPVILHAEYAAGIRTITGLNLEDASFLLSASNAYYTVKLKALRFLKATEHTWYKRQPWGRLSDTKEDVVTLPARMAWKEMEEVFVYATKKVQIGVDGRTVDATSKAVRITDCFWKTAYGLWIPCITLWTLLIYNTRGLLRTLPPELPNFISEFVFSTSGPFAAFPLLLIVVLFTNPSSRVAEFFMYHGETLLRALGQGLLIVYYGFKSLKGPDLRIHFAYARYWAARLPPFGSPPPPRPPSAPPPAPPPSSSRVQSKLPPDEGRGVSLNSSHGKKKSVDDPDWSWPAFDRYEDKNVKIELKECSEKVPDEVNPFQVIYRHRKLQVWPDAVRVEFMSAPLIKIVQKFLPQNDDLQTLTHPKVNGRHLFVVLDGLKNHDPKEKRQDFEDDENKGPLHLKHLIRFMDKEYSDVSLRLRRMTEEKRVAWDMLWTFLTPGRKVVYNCNHTQAMLAAVVSKNSYTLDSAFVVDLEVWDFDGRTYRPCQMKRRIEKFDGEVAFSGLAVRPVELEGVPEAELDAGFLANGKRFYELALKDRNRFMHYSGPLYQLRKINPNAKESFVGLTKENADGRVMIDISTFAKMNPEYPMGNAKPPVRKGVDSADGRKIRFEGNEEILDLTKPHSVIVADETLIFAPAMVYGFSFTMRQWGSFAIRGFSEINFNTSAFDSLMMEPDSKELVYKLVSQYIATPVSDPSQDLQRVDPIARKGDRCIFLCYGPPGTGKTLTAETVAESMHRPLWSLSASELGGTPSDLEENLVEVQEIAATWQAVLLLDEADGFLQKRSAKAGVTHNAMTGAFLRFLEYYRGVLFLSTNRIGTFDDAFRSRISMFLRYPKLSTQQKEQVWMTLLERAGATGITPDHASELAVEDLNGREIRNAIHTAQLLAKSNGESLDPSHVRHATRVLVSTLKTLSDTIAATGGSDLG